MHLADNEWRQIFELAQSAADLPSEERRKFLQDATEDQTILDRAMQLAEEFAAEAAGSNLAVGAQLGRFTLTEVIGRGGLGQVFLAKDPELDRLVAIKVLHSDLSEAFGSSRLIQEARMACALNHPNIVTVYEVVKIDSTIAIVMEYVPGQSLRKWIRGPHPLPESLELMVQMAGAVEAAHAAGIVHRDLKPENVIVRPDGRLKVLDFGLAKSLHVGSGPAQSASISNVGGTFFYMSPEQAQGKPPGTASDIFSLGILFYELVTGQHPFGQSSGTDWGKPVAQGPPPAQSSQVTAIPTALHSLILQMLAEEPSGRPTALQTLERIAEIQSDSGKIAKVGATLATRSGRLLWLVALLSIVVAAMATWRAGRSHSAVPASRIATDVTLLPLANELGYYNSPTFSPDGKRVAFSWNGRKQDNFDIYIQVIGSHEPRRLTSTADADYSPAWSPDDKTIAFCRDSRGGNAAIWIMSAAGGSEQKLVELHWRADYGNRHLSWSADSKRIAFPDRRPDRAETNVLFEFDLTSRVIRQITFPTGAQIDVQPAYSPDGKFLAFIRDLGGGDDHIYLLPLKPDSAPYPLQWDEFNALGAGRETWTPDSQTLLFVADSHVWAGAAGGHAKPTLLSSLGTTVYDTAISRTGTLVTVNRHYDSDIYRLDLGAVRRGSHPAPTPLVDSTRLELNPKVSPDGQKIAFESNRSGYAEVWIANIDGSNPLPLTEMQNSITGSPSWSPDGRWLVFDSRRTASPQLYIAPARGGNSRKLGNDEGDAVVPAWSPDGRWIYFSSDRGGRFEVWRIPSGGGQPERFSRNGGFAPCVSPDGSWLYYAADRGVVTQLRALNLLTRQETIISRQALRRNYAAAPNGVYYVSRQANGRGELLLTDTSGRTKPLFQFDKPLSDGLDVSSDGSVLYFGELDQDGTELMQGGGFWH